MIGHDLLSELQIILNFKQETVTREESTIKMKDYDALLDISSPSEHEFYWHEEEYESQVLNDASSHLKKILARRKVQTSRS